MVNVYPKSVARRLPATWVEELRVNSVMDDAHVFSARAESCYTVGKILADRHDAVRVT
jgi:hypothetical protein